MESRSSGLPGRRAERWLAMGGTLGIAGPGAAGEGFAPLLFAIPWVLTAVLSLLLFWPPRWMPRRLLLTAGSSATAIAALIGPAACWTLLRLLVTGGDPGIRGIVIWVPGLFYSSWFFFGIAAGTATCSYQLHSAAIRAASATWTEKNVRLLSRNTIYAVVTENTQEYRQVTNHGTSSGCKNSSGSDCPDGIDGRTGANCGQAAGTGADKTGEDVRRVGAAG